LHFPILCSIVEKQDSRYSKWDINIKEKNCSIYTLKSYKFYCV